MIRVTISGRVYEFPNESVARRELRRMIDFARNRIEDCRGDHQEFIERMNLAMRIICDVVANTWIPEIAMWDRPKRHVQDAVQSLGMYVGGDYSAVARYLTAADREFRTCQSRWSQYLDRTVEGGENTAAGLELFSGLCIGVSMTVLAGPAATAVGAQGVMQTAAVSAGLNVVTTAVAEIGREEMESVLNVDPEVNWERLSRKIASSFVASFVSSAVSGWLRPLIIARFGNFSRLASTVDLSGELPRVILSIETNIPVLARVGSRFLALVPATMASEAAREVVNQIGTRRPMNEFIDAWLKKCLEKGGARLIGQLIVGITASAATG